MKLAIAFQSLAVRSASVLSPALLLFTGCSGPYGETWGGGGYVVPASEPTTQPDCTDWYAYDEPWHRRHCDDPGWVWCNAPGAGTGSTASSDAGANGVAAADTGATPTATPDGALASSLDSGAPSSSGSSSGNDSGAAGNGPTSDASSLADAGGATIEDGGASGQAGDGAPVGACTDSTTCAVGTSCVAGLCQPCSGGVCVCQRDDDCPASQICDHAAGTCAAPPPACTALTTEAACTARADCSPIYGGMMCTNDAGSECHSGEANCTCVTYSFAACVARGM